jgi:hypothetical protein
MLLLFKTLNLYIKVSKNKIEITNLENSETISEIAINKFSNNRIIIADFISAELLLRSMIKRILPNKNSFFIRVKVVVQQIEEFEGGLTDIEKRGYRDLCEQVGCIEVHLVQSFKPLTIEEAMIELKKTDNY